MSHLNWFYNCGNAPVSSSYKKIKNTKTEICNDTSSDESSSDSEIIANFELVDPTKNHFHGIRALLSRLFVGLNLELSTLVDQIIHQSDASSVLVQEDGGQTVFGIICALSLSPSSTDTHEWKLFNQELTEWICEIFKNHQELHSMITLKHCALLFNERFVNIPEIVGQTMCQSLNDELLSMKGKPFDYYIFISKSYSKNLSQNKRDMQSFNLEDNAFYKNADFFANYSVFDECGPVSSGAWDDTDSNFIPFRSIFIISAEKLFLSLNYALKLKYE